MYTRVLFIRGLFLFSDIFRWYIKTASVGKMSENRKNDIHARAGIKWYIRRIYAGYTPNMIFFGRIFEVILLQFVQKQYIKIQYFVRKE